MPEWAKAVSMVLASGIAYVLAPLVASLVVLMYTSPSGRKARS